jgi:hypothetical protein
MNEYVPKIGDVFDLTLVDDYIIEIKRIPPNSIGYKWINLTRSVEKIESHLPPVGVWRTWISNPSFHLYNEEEKLQYLMEQ